MLVFVDSVFAKMYGLWVRMVYGLEGFYSYRLRIDARASPFCSNLFVRSQGLYVSVNRLKQCTMFRESPFMETVKLPDKTLLEAPLVDNFSGLKVEI